MIDMDELYKSYKDRGIIKKNIYDKIRNTYKSLCKFWNGILQVWNDKTNESFPYRYVPGRKGSKIAMNETVPTQYRFPQTKNYEGRANEVNENSIKSDFGRIHTLGNENNIRRNIITLNNIVHNWIGIQEGFDKINLKIIGKETSEDFTGINKNTNIENKNDVYNGKYMIINPDSTSKIEYNVLSDPSSLEQKDVLTYEDNLKMKLSNDDIVKKTDYENINKVLDRIQNSLNSRSKWFTSGLCSRQCQVSCQRTCQLACQGCNTKQCHNQKCGTH